MTKPYGLRYRNIALARLPKALDGSIGPTRAMVATCGWENGKAWHYNYKLQIRIWTPNLYSGQIDA